MRDNHTSNTGEGASLSRRNFLSIAAVGAAATSPAVALAEASGKTGRLPQFSLEQQLDICIANLKNVLAAMHPEADDVRHLYIPQNNGRSYIFGLSGHAPALEVWDGAGLYEVGDSQKLPAGIYFVDRHWSPLDRSWGFSAAFVWEGKIVPPRESIDPRLIVRKVGGGAK